MEPNGEEGLIKRLEEEENIIALILNDENYLNWQNPNEVRSYIKNNWRLVETVGAFSAYEKEE